MSEELLKVQNLKKFFQTPGGSLHAVDDVSFSINEASTLGVVGESGCGKSTLGRTILRLNGRMTVKQLIAEPLIINKICHNKSEQEERVVEAMKIVGLAERLAFAYPHELDGGRRQRIGIARALILNPEFIVCDEQVSALDVSIQAQILNLLMDLQEERNLTYLFITHDLSVVKHISDEIMVMYLGKCVEKASAQELFANPLHPYTKALLAAIPIPSVESCHKRRELLQGEVTSPVNPKPGCRFAARCPKACEKCHEESMELQEVSKGHWVACPYV